MDSLTQVVAGGIIGNQTLGKQFGNKAVLWGAIIGTIPDLDVFLSEFHDTVDALFIHRGFSHSLIFCLLVTLPLAFLLDKIYKRKNINLFSWIKFTLFILLGAVFIDYLTGYGASIFWPFSQYRIELNSISIVDAFFTIPLLILLILTLFRNQNKRIITNKIAVFWAIFYLFLTGINKLYVNKTFENQLKQNKLEYEKLYTAPLPLTNFLWMGIAKTENGYWTGYYSLFDKSEIQFVHVSRNQHLLSKYKNNKKVQDLIRFTKHYYTVQKSGNKLIINDLRFGKIGIEKEAEYIFSFLLEENDNSLKIIENEREINISNEDFNNYLKRIFSIDSK